MLALIRSLMPGNESVLQEKTIALMMQNQLPAGMGIAFPGLGNFSGKALVWAVPLLCNQQPLIRPALRMNLNGAVSQEHTGGFHHATIWQEF